MYVSDDMVEGMAGRYGSPARVSFLVECTGADFEFIRSTQKADRSHDVTMYVFKGDQVIVNAKPFYPPGMFRAPSGGLEPGESFEDGMSRELQEELGCRAAVERFLLVSRVSFVRGDTGRVLQTGDGRWLEEGWLRDDIIKWTSYVFQLSFIDGDFAFTDREEIREVGRATLEDFSLYARQMRASTKGGLHYRAALHEAVVPNLNLEL